jgi:hypothetical protein
MDNPFLTYHHQLINIFGMLLIGTGILDAAKYAIQGNKIQVAKSAKNFSRQFMNFALGNDLIKLAYGLIIWDFYIVLTSILALVTMIYMWYQIFLWYPYKKRGLNNFKRPNIFIYIINSLLPNSLRRKL